MAAPLTSSQSSLASQLLQKGIVICPSPCGSGLARDGSAADFKPAPTEKPHNLPAPPVGAGLPAMAALLSSRQSSLASQLLQKSSIAIRPSPCGSGLARDDGAADFRQSSLASQLLQKGIAICPSSCGSGLARDDGAADFKAELAGKPAPTERHRNLPPPSVGAGLPAMAAPLSSRQSSLASQLLQISIAA